MPPEEESPAGRVVRRDFALGCTTLALGSFSIGSFLLGCLFLFSFFAHLLLGMPVDDPCCTSILNCRPCEKMSGVYYPYLFISLLAFFISIAPWVAVRLYRRSKASENR